MWDFKKTSKKVTKKQTVIKYETWVPYIVIESRKDNDKDETGFYVIHTATRTEREFFRLADAKAFAVSVLNGAEIWPKRGGQNETN